MFTPKNYVFTPKIYVQNKSLWRLLIKAEQSPHFVRPRLAFERRKFAKWQRAQIRSSETSRETPKYQFDFSPFSTSKSSAFAQNTQKQKERLLRKGILATNKRDFLEWFVGFFEAEGCCIFWKDAGKLRFRIEVTQQDKDLIYFIQKQFGFGTVIDIVRRTGNPCWRYQVEDLQSLLDFIDLLNGNLVLQKRRATFETWLQAFNTTNNTSIPFIEGGPQVLLTDGWLSGFLEGDGGFSVPQNFIRTNKRSQAYNLKLRFFVTQKDASDLITQLRILFKVTNLERNLVNTVYNRQTGLKEKRFYNRMDTATLEAGTILLDYLTRFPFLGKRQITVEAWKELIKYRKTKFPVTPSTTATIQKYIDQTKRIESQLQADSPVEDLESINFDIESINFDIEF